MSMQNLIAAIQFCAEIVAVQMMAKIEPVTIPPL
ncbi:MAG: hypothetical protein JWP34_3349 [Massilia sp.]|nr:hypothetical protein [Massilia sp.]